MDRGAARTGPYEGRYERLTGGRDRRLLLYLLVSRAGLTIDSALLLPWWQWDLLVEGVEWDLEREANLAGAETGAEQHVGDVTALGLTVRTAQG